MNPSFLRAKNIHKTFHSPETVSILSGVDLEVKQGESIAIMGASGEGKTTFLHILGTLEKPDIGEIEIGKSSIKTFSACKLRSRHIGFIFQAYNLLEDLTTLENVLMPARIARKPITKSSPSYQHALELLDLVGLKERSHFPIKILSGGEKQRVAIARAFCNDPDFILADEPSGNLDYDNSQMIHKLLLTCVKKKNKGLIIVTHDKDLAYLCDRVYLLKKGNLFPLNKEPFNP